MISVFLSVFVIPALPESWARDLVRPSFTVIYLSAIFSLDKGRKIILYLSAGAFFFEWISMLFEMPILYLLSRSMNILFFYMVIMFLIRQMARSKFVDARVIMGSISGYLLIGMIFSSLVAMIMTRDPGAYNITSSATHPVGSESHLNESVYYGFITMTTVGYGDVVPLKPYARSLSTLISVTGQLYIAIIIAVLVGKFASGQQKG